MTASSTSSFVTRPNTATASKKSATSRWPITTSTGANAYIPLSELATITLDTGAAWIYHESVQRFIPVKFSVRGRDLGSTVEEAQERIAKNVKLPPGYRLVWAGEFGDLQEAKKRLEVIVPISLVLILGLLYSLFNSLARLPVDAGGHSLRCRRRSAGAVCLRPELQRLRRHWFCLALWRVRHGWHSDDYLLQPREAAHGGTPTDAMFRAASTRMRPLLMTALSACIGLFPAAISTGIGSQVQRPLATVIVGGMLVGPFMLLVVVPALRMIFLGHENGATPEAESTMKFTCSFSADRLCVVNARDKLCRPSMVAHPNSRLPQTSENTLGDHPLCRQARRSSRPQEPARRKRF